MTADDVAVVYRELLGRDATPADVQHQLAAAPSLRALLDAVFASDEYARRRRAEAEAVAATASPPPPPLAVVNIHTESLAPWGHPPGTWSDDGVAVMGHAGWVFLGTGTNAVLDQYRGEATPPDGFDDRWSEAVDRRRQDAADLGAEFVGIVVPDKLPVLREHVHEPLPAHVQAPAARLTGRAELDLLYPVQELSDVPGGAYLRTDTHLTYAGNAALAGVIGARLGMDLRHELTPDRTARYVTSGDLGSRFAPPVVEIVTTANDFGAARVVEDNREQIAAVGGHIGTRQVLRNKDAQDPRTVVIFGDSYAFGAAHYQGLAWWLAQAFREVHFVWVPFGWDPDYVENAGATVVVCQCAERFVIRPPAPRVNALELAAETLARRRPALIDEVSAS